MRGGAMMDVRIVIAALPNLIFSVIVISVTIWLYRVFTVTGNERTAILLYGLAVISFVTGIVIIVGLHPKWVYAGGFRKSGGLVGSGPWWGGLFIIPLSVTLFIIANHYAKKGHRKPFGPWHSYGVRFEIY
jgi:hypothetical protein